MDMNFGRLQGYVPMEKNIVYFRRGNDELSLNITNACPNACVFCIRDYDLGWGVSNLYMDRDPDIKEILGAFDQEAQWISEEGTSIKRVKICGYGEPILRFNDLASIVTHVKKKCPKTTIQLTTTRWPYFRFISQDTAPLRELKAAGLDIIYLSLHALDEEQYKRLVRPGITTYDTNAFSDSLRFARATREAGFQLKLGFIRVGAVDELGIKALAAELDAEYELREFEK